MQPRSLQTLLPYGLGLLLSLSAPAVQASQLENGQVQFDRSPVLVESGAIASRSQSGGIYYFTIRLPQDAGESLGAVLIALQTNQRDTQFDLDQTEAFLGTPSDRATDLRLQSVQQQQPDQIRLTFAAPIPPGATFTVGLHPSERPGRHRYEFEVTAFPSSGSPASTNVATNIASNTAPGLEPIGTEIATEIGTETISFRGDRFRDYPFWWNPDDIFPGYSKSDYRALFWDLPPEFHPRFRQRLRQQQQIPQLE